MTYPIQLPAAISISQLPQGASPTGAELFEGVQNGNSVQFTTSQISNLSSVGVSVKEFGATGNGVTDDTAAIQAAANSVLALNGGTVFFPPGIYKISSAITDGSNDIPVQFIGAGSRGWTKDQTPWAPNSLYGTLVTAGTTDTSTFILSSKGSSIKNMAIFGANKVGATHPAILLQTDPSGPGANDGKEQRVERVAVRYGKYNIQATSGDWYLSRVNFGIPYGQTAFFCTSGGYFDQLKLDAGNEFPAGTPSTFVWPAWTSATPITTGAMRVIGTLACQATIGGTTGGSQPTVATYDTTFTDGTVTWQAVFPSPLYGLQYDGGGNLGPVIGCDSDISAYYDGAVLMSGSQPGQLVLTGINFAAMTNFVNITANPFGTYVILVGCAGNIVGDRTGTACINVGSGFNGDIKIAQCELLGAITGIQLNGCNTAAIVGNAIYPGTAVNATAIHIAAGVGGFQIIGNQLGSSPSAGANLNGVVIDAGGSDGYTVWGNDFVGLTGTPLTDGGTGTRKMLEKNGAIAGILRFAGSSSGATSLQAAAAASGVLTLPAATDTLVGKATTDTLTNKTLTTPTITSGAVFSGSSSGSTTLQPSATASGTITMPAATDQLVARATTDTLTNKTFDTASNVFDINGTQVTTASDLQTQVAQFYKVFKLATVNFNSANNDNQIVLSLPTGFTRWQPHQIFITHPSTTFATATFQAWTSAGGAGTQLLTTTTAAITSTADGASGNSQFVAPTVGTGQTFTLAGFPNFFFRTVIAQGGAATADVNIVIRCLP